MILATLLYLASGQVDFVSLPRVRELGAARARGREGNSFAYFEAFPMNGAGAGTAAPAPNWVTYSEQYDNAAWTKDFASASGVLTPNAAIAPDGTLTAERLQCTTGAWNCRIFQGISSIPEKATQQFRVKGNGTSGTIYVSFLGAGGSTACAYGPTGWTTCGMTSTNHAGAAGYAFLGCEAGNYGMPNPCPTLDVFIWGHQVNLGSTLGAYVKTDAAAKGFTPTASKGEPMTFARTSTATASRTAAGGLALSPIYNGDLVIMPAGQSRVEVDSSGYLGLLLEALRINSCLRSDEFDNAVWTATNDATGATVPTVTANFASAPTEFLTAERLQTGDCTSAGFISKVQQQVAMTAGIAATGSVYVRGNGTSGTLSLCSYTASGACTPCTYAAGYWTRCVHAVASTAVTTYFSLGCVNSASYTGSAGAAAADVFVAGAQLEAGAFVTSLIPTTSAAVTRAVESASFPLGLSTASDFLVAENLSWSGFGSAGCAGDTIFSATPGPYLNSCFSSIGYGGVIATVGTGANGGSASSPSRIGVEWVRSTSTSRILVNGSYFAPSTNVSTASAGFGSFTLGAVGIHSRLCGDSSLSRCR